LDCRARYRANLHLIAFWIDAGFDKQLFEADIHARGSADAQTLHSAEIAALGLQI
jgi:hypothetical protein